MDADDPLGPASAHPVPNAGTGEGDLAELLATVMGARRLRPALEELPGRPLAALARARPPELVHRHGLRPTEARRLAAAFELGRRVARLRPLPGPPVDRAERVGALLADRVRGLEREVFFVVLLDGRHRVKRVETVSVGTLTTSLVHPREVFLPAVREGAAAIVCAHNHPSGDPEPSADDLAVTRRLLRAARILGVPLLDHVVLGEGRTVSLRTRMAF